MYSRISDDEVRRRVTRLLDRTEPGDVQVLEFDPIGNQYLVRLLGAWGGVRAVLYASQDDPDEDVEQGLRDDIEIEDGEGR